MHIVFRTRDILADLFPDVTPDDPDALIRRLEAFYGVAGLVPHVSVDGEAVTVELDEQREEAFAREVERAAALAQAGKYRDATRFLEPLIEQHPAVSDLHRMRAQILFEQGDGRAAVDPLIEALRWDPENRYALLLMGNVQFRTLRDVDTAKRYYDRAAALDPTDHLVLNNLGAVMMEAGRIDEAGRYFDLAREAAPDYPNTHFGLALMHARQGDMVGAFSRAVRTLKLATPRDPVYAAALDTAQKAAATYTRQTPPEDLYRAYAEEVARAAGKPVDIEADRTLPAAAKIEIAEYRGRSRHVVKYMPDAPAVAHLVAHELAHLDLIAEARDAGTNLLFTTRDALRARFTEDTQRDVQALVRNGLPAVSAAEFVASLYDGLNSQVYNAPVDLFIEDMLHRHLELRPVQFASLFSMLTSFAESATNRDIRKMTPRRVFEANVVLNLTHALQFRDLYGVDLTPDFRADRRLVREAERLYAEFVEAKDDRKPGEEYEFVADWAHDLNVANYFELVPESPRADDHPPTPPAADVPSDVSRPTASARSPEDALADVQADPLNLDDEDRAALRVKEISLAGSPAASMAVTMYLLDALKLFQQGGPDVAKAVALEVGMLGNYGLDADDPAQKYTLRSVPGKKFSALHLLAYMYAGFQTIDPSLNTGLQFADEYAMAQSLLPLP